MSFRTFAKSVVPFVLALVVFVGLAFAFGCAGAAVRRACGDGANARVGGPWAGTGQG